ncbi:hypothetical protein PFTANZ_05197 [Plasmodium falciparum Tanzania (2000708)]|uniref:Uncharacterized protein n=1 Tax=Plasmodium falciparum Tanzania (2000708) TaxID=1036725 RepID=A0A024W013_PLAFA|nr:hypothetical protein PFTANZ_05197 [Plasmodium falciparum Tanzania (2000708)]
MHPFYDNLEILEGGTHTIALPSIRDQINDGSLFLQKKKKKKKKDEMKKKPNKMKGLIYYFVHKNFLKNCQTLFGLIYTCLSFLRKKKKKKKKGTYNNI